MIIRYFESMSGGSMISFSVSSVSWAIKRLFSRQMMFRLVETIKNTVNSIHLSIPTLPFGENYGRKLSRSREYFVVNDRVFEVRILHDLVLGIFQSNLEIGRIFGPTGHKSGL